MQLTTERPRVEEGLVRPCFSVTASQEGRCGVQPANEKYDMAKRTGGGYGDSVELQGTGLGHALPAKLQEATCTALFHSYMHGSTLKIEYVPNVRILSGSRSGKGRKTKLTMVRPY